MILSSSLVWPAFCFTFLAAFFDLVLSLAVVAAAAAADLPFSVGSLGAGPSTPSFSSSWPIDTPHSIPLAIVIPPKIEPMGPMSRTRRTILEEK
jgi:hypothetical protein